RERVPLLAGVSWWAPVPRKPIACSPAIRGGTGADGMTLTDHDSGLRTSRWFGRIPRIRLVLATAAIVLGAFWAIGYLPLLPALIGLALIAAAALVGA